MLADYHLRKKYNYCVQCGKQDAYTLNGRARCFECQTKQNQYRQSHPEYNENHKELNKKRYLERKEKGLCTRCGNEAEKGKTKCKKCLLKDRINHKNNSNSIGRTLANDLGLCVNCLKEPQLKGHKLCENCYERALKSIEYARGFVSEKHKKEYGHFIYGKVIRNDQLRKDKKYVG